MNYLCESDVTTTVAVWNSWKLSDYFVPVRASNFRSVSLYVSLSSVSSLPPSLPPSLSLPAPGLALLLGQEGEE